MKNHNDECLIAAIASSKFKIKFERIQLHKAVCAICLVLFFKVSTKSTKTAKNLSY